MCEFFAVLSDFGKVPFVALFQSTQPGNDYRCHCEEPPPKGRRRGNLPVQPNNLHSRNVRRIALQMPSILAFLSSYTLPGDCHGPNGPRNDTVVEA